jgi:hypothetical protein
MNKVDTSNIVDKVDSIRAVLSGGTIVLDQLEGIDGIFDQVDAFVNLSRDNKTVKEVLLYPFTDPPGNDRYNFRYDIWEKVAEGIGNLQALRTIVVNSEVVDEFNEALVPDWEILACILRRLRRGIQLDMIDNAQLWDPEVLPVFDRAIHGQAMITGFRTGEEIQFDCLDPLCSTLLTLPALEKVSFNDFIEQSLDEGQYFENMVKLLQSPVLRVVEFVGVFFSDSLSQAIAEALKERSEITDLYFCGCSFPDGGGVLFASALKTNATLKRLEFDVRVEEVFYDVLVVALLSNSTLQKLALCMHDGTNSLWLSPLFLALQVNTGLKELRISFETSLFSDEPPVTLMDEKLSKAIRLGLEMNSTLESLELANITSVDNDISLWRDAFSFLRTNTALKALTLDFEQDVTESDATAIRMEFPAVLCENESLETLAIMSHDARFEDYLVFVAAIQPNTTLKKVHFQTLFCRIDKDETKDLVSALKKNYGLEVIPALSHGENVCSILQLNGAGRRYLVQDGSSISKGVAVLSAVSKDINSVFLHLLENPRLCDRSAVETPSIGNIENTVSASSRSHSVDGSGKREQHTPAQRGKESRRRLQ